jgi:hypothetical protein
MTDTTVTGSFNTITTVSSGYEWQVQGLLTALQPAVNADKSLNYQTAMTDAGHAGASPGMGFRSMPVASKLTMPAEEVGEIVQSTLAGMLSDQPQTPGGSSWQYDTTLAGLLGPALRTVFANVAGSQNQPWFGWGAATTASTAYNYNLLFAYTSTGAPASYISIFILGLTVTVNLAKQQLLSLTPGTSATYAVTATAIPGMITGKLQPAPPVPISSIPPGPFNLVAPAVSATYGWQVQGLLTALQPAVNADKSLNYQTAMTDAGHAGASPGMGFRSMPVASKLTMPAEEVGEIVQSTLAGMLSDQPQTPGGSSWQYDTTLAGLLGPALRTVFANVAGSQNQPWFGWGAATTASTAYNYNLLFAYTSTGAPASYISIFILGLTVTVNLTKQQLLSLTPGTSATYAVTATATAIPGMITGKLQTLS